MVEALNLLEIPDLLYDYFKAFLYVPNIAADFEPFIHFLPRTVWNVVEALVGFDASYHIDLGELPMMARNDVGGTSSKNIMHWFQWIRSGKFQEFDYGQDGNLAQYGQKTPPQYNVKDFPTRLDDVNILLFVGDKDAFVTPDDFKFLKSNLPKDSQIFYVPDYNHLDYMWGVDANSMVNYEVLNFLSTLN